MTFLTLRGTTDVAELHQPLMAVSTMQSTAVPIASDQGSLRSYTHASTGSLVWSGGALELYSAVGVFNRMRVYGETFQIELDDDRVYLRHPTWSLMGVGETAGIAALNLLSEAHELAQVMVDMSPTELSDEATELREFAIRFL